MNLSGYATLSEVASQHSINYHTVRRRVVDRKVRTKRVGCMIFVLKADVKKVIKKRGSNARR